MLTLLEIDLIITGLYQDMDTPKGHWPTISSLIFISISIIIIVAHIMDSVMASNTSLSKPVITSELALLYELVAQVADLQ